MSWFEHHIHGIPCRVEVLTARHQHPNPNSWDSPEDYHGGWTIEFQLLDRRGYTAYWLERLMTKEEQAEIEALIVSQAQTEELEHED